MNQIITDMHFHTSYSDGRLENKEIISKIKTNIGGLYIATDHDIVNSDFTKLAKEEGLKSCEGAEISILDEKCGYIHITAYAKKFNTEIISILEKTRNGRRSRLYKQIEVLKNNGIYINENDFFSFFEEKGINIFNLNVYHLASFIYRFEYNRNLIEKMTLIKDKVEFLKRCLRNEGDYAHIGSAYVEEYTPNTQTIIEFIHNNNGICSIAHPNFTFNENEFEKNINHFLELGFNAIEIGPKTTEEQIYKILKLIKNDHLITFGSDCHFTPYSEAEHSEIGELNTQICRYIIRKNIFRIMERLDI